MSLGYWCCILCVYCCSDGASQSGLFCAVSYLVERLKLEQEVDVFQSTKHVKINRPQLVPNVVSDDFLLGRTSLLPSRYWVDTYLLRHSPLSLSPVLWDTFYLVLAIILLDSHLLKTRKFSTMSSQWLLHLPLIWALILSTYWLKSTTWSHLYLDPRVINLENRN